MKIEPKAFLAIERSMAAAMHAEWDKLASEVVSQAACRHRQEGLG